MFNVSYRIKTNESLENKWKRNLNKSKQIREVCNDLLAFRIVGNIPLEDIKKSIELMVKDIKTGIEVVDFYNKPKSVDDGYRGLHCYFKTNSKSFPVEIQYWKRKDALLNFYTHEIIYKNQNIYLNYSKELREWIDNLPEKPLGLDIDFIDFWYNMFLENEEE